MTGRAELLREHRVNAERRRARLEAEIAALRIQRGGESADDEHDPEGTTLSSEWSRLEGLRAAATSELAGIDDALARLDDGRYGVCVACGRAISSARLEARPTATRCVECASKPGR
jgi:RNA polymerase-binding transcription factor DksA